MVGAFGLCTLVAYGIVPLVEGRTYGAAVLPVAALATVLALSAFRGARTLWRDVAAARALSLRIEAGAIPASARLRLAAREASLEGRVVLIDTGSTCSFVFGARSPTVVLSTGLLSRLSAEELQAALEHERYHVLSLDPLRSTVARVVVAALFFLPGVRTINRRYEAGRELAADRRAVAVVGRRPLAAALLKAMEGTAASGEQPAGIPLAAHGVIALRLVQLETGCESHSEARDSLQLGATTAGAIAFAGLLVGVSASVGGGAALAREFSPAGLLEGLALCLLPFTAAAALGYRSCFSSRSAKRPR
jgi:Zn-dependent protease with chaperone function